MTEENFIWYMMLMDIFFPIALYYIVGFNIERREECLKEFYFALRENKPRSYVKPNIVLKFVRKKFRLKTDGTIHWMTCFLHYIQIFMGVSPAIMIVVLIFAFSEKVVIFCAIFGIAIPISLCCILHESFTYLQVLRCEKIKKTNPSYSNRKIHYWRRY